MAKAESSGLARLACLHGIQTSFIDDTGQEQLASEETLRLILERLGVRVSSKSDIEDSVRNAQERSDQRLINPVTICRPEQESLLRVNKGRKARRLAISLTDETGREIRLHLKPAEPDRIALPKLPMGYYRAELECGGWRESALIIAAPTKLYTEKQGRRPVREWGMFLPLYAAHSRKSWGAGNLSDWRELSEWAAQQGASVMGTLPVMAAFLDKPISEPSPYSPASRLFWNEFFIDITAVLEFRESTKARRIAGAASFQKKLAAFRESEFVAYRDEWALRRRVLEVMAEEFYQKGGGAENSSRNMFVSGLT
jgi:4-alpha-glucanotransferase